jgi:two-component system nitrogen regulation sensor histidine kinase NtrY
MMVDGGTAPLADAQSATFIQDRRASFALPGILLAGGALVCAILTLLVLLGLTPIAPTGNVVIASAVINSLFIIGLMYLIGREVTRLLRARNRGRAAARLHVRIVVLFSIVAITPAVLVAIFASLTLNVGLDRWFSLRTQSIVQSSQDIARAYMMENASYLQGQTVSMSNDLERNRAMFYLDRTGFLDLMTRQARGRGMLGAFLVQEDGQAIAQADIKTERPLPAIPADALKSAAGGQPTLIPPGITNLVGAVMKTEAISGTFLYTIRAVDPKVMNAMRLMEENTAEYKAMEAGRSSLQFAFAVLYLGFALIVLLAAIWAAIAVADRIVRPIRLLISAADAVGSGNLNVVVPVRAADGDVGSLSRTFNKMISEIRTQQDEILEAKDEVDDRRRFIEAVLSGVTAAVIGVDDRRISIVNPSAEVMLGQAFGNLVKNAVEAIEMVPADEERDGRKVMVRSGFDKARDLFVVDVIDNGIGLPTENRHRILEPYMTMREKGTGLGLAIVKKIIEEHGGQLELHDAPADFDHGKGAMIRVLLPHVDAVGAPVKDKDKEIAYGV